MSVEKEVNTPIRVNTRISVRYNDWLDQRSLETSLSKSALINMAIENYIKEVEITANLKEMLQKTEGLENLQSEMEDLKKQLREIKEK